MFNSKLESIMAGQPLLLLSTFILVATMDNYSRLSKLRHVSNNSCAGYTLTLECTVVGGYGTLWRGSALNCDIILLHDYFGSPNYKKSCTDSNIVGGNVQKNEVENGTYTYYSQLNVTVTPNMIGKSVECVHNCENTSVIRSYMIFTDCLSPPGNVHISNVDIGSRQLTFDWSRSPVAPDCPAVHYNILASNCGSCPTTTNHTNVTCTDVLTNGKDIQNMLCIFAIRTVICGNISGNASDRISLDVIETVIHNDRGTQASTVMLIAGVLSLSLVLIGIILLTTGTVYCRLKAKPKISSGSENTSARSTRILEENKDEYSQLQLQELPLELQSLLQKLQGQVSKQWYQFGLSLGIPMDVLEEFNHYSSEGCLAEVLDYWLKNHPGKPTWQQIIDAQREILIFNARQNEVSVKKVNQGEPTIDMPPPKPPRRSSSVIVKEYTISTDATTTSKMNCHHEYECIN